LPRCVIEGLACGAPVVSFDVCSVREILEGHECGRAVNQGDYGNLVTAIAALCDNPDERARLAGRGPEVATRLFDARRNGDLYADLVTGLS
jgi:phosphatidylinositol alpha-mannosyltransferase